jgi:hypothetical protein
MATDPLQESNRVKLAKFVAITLCMIGVAIAAFFLAEYATDIYGLRIPAENLWISILLLTAGLMLSGIALRGGGSWNEIASLGLPALMTALVALRFGMPGVLSALIVGYFVYLVERWRRARQPNR